MDIPTTPTNNSFGFRSLPEVNSDETNLAARPKMTLPKVSKAVVEINNDKTRDCRFRISQSIQSTGKLQLDGKIFDFTSDDLRDLGEIGRGGFGTVNKMVHRKSSTTMAVKRIRSTVDEKEQKQLLMDLEVVMKSNECPCIVQFYGALFKEVNEINKLRNFSHRRF